MIQTAIFKLKCVLCGVKEDRPAEQCREMQFCNRCLAPMVLVRVSIKTKKN